MRTVSFSQPNVCKLLDQNFVCFHTSTEGDPTAGQSIRHRPGDPAGMCIRGNGQQNVQTIFLTPAGEIFHVVTGFASGDDLAQELLYAHELFGELQQASRKPERAPASIVADSHRKRLANYGFSDQQIESQGMLLGGMAMPDLNAMMNPTGSMNRGGNQTTPAAGVFDAMIRGQVLADHQFCIRNPLMTSRQLERDPAVLVGSGQSFFMSNSSGN